MSSADRNGIGIRGWLAGQKPKPKIEEARTEPPILDKHRIAVLPFNNISPNPKEEYFADGLTEELIARISLLKGLEVIARTSIMNYKNEKKNASQIGRELRSGTLLEGSVRKAGNRIRVTAQLIDANTEGHLWAENYDRDIDDIFAVQSSIAEKVAGTLRLKLLDEELKRIERGGPRNSEAHEEYLRARYLWYVGDEPSLRKAIQHLEKAIQLEPNYPEAMAHLAACYGSLGVEGYEPRDKAYVKGKEFALKALESDETNPEAHNSLAFIQWVGGEGFVEGGDPAKIDAEILRALELNPNYADARTQHAAFLLTLNSVEEAISEIEKSIVLDPISAFYQSTAGWIYQVAGRYSEALAHFERAQEINPNLHAGRGITLLLIGRIDEGLKELEKSLELHPESSWAKGYLAYAYGASGREGDALRLAEDLKTVSGKGPASYCLAFVHAGLGEKEEALACLEKASEEHVLIQFPSFNNDPLFASLRREVKFQELVRKVGLDRDQRR